MGTFRWVLALMASGLLAGCASSPSGPLVAPKALAKPAAWQVPNPFEWDALARPESIPDPGSRWRHERLVGWLLDARAAGDAELVRQIWSNYGGEILDLANPLAPEDEGSWNLPVMAGVGGYLQGNPIARSVLLEYLRRQLESDHPNFHGLMGREPLSAFYWWPAIAIAMAHDHAVEGDDGEIQVLASRWLRSYSWLLTLGALPQGHGEMSTTICLPGARTAEGQECNPQIAYFWERSAGRATPLPQDWLEHHEMWPARVASVLRYGWLTPEASRRLDQHREAGDQGAWLLERLQAENVRTRVPFQFYRTDGGLAAIMGLNPHPSTPPLLGLVIAEGRRSYCHLWPAGFHSGGVQGLGTASAAIGQRTVHCQTQGADWPDGSPGPGTEWIGEDIVAMQLPLPGGTVLYDLTIDWRGARESGGEDEAEGHSGAPSSALAAPSSLAVPSTVSSSASADALVADAESPWAVRLRDSARWICSAYDALATGQGLSSERIERIHRAASDIVNQTKDFVE